MQACYDRVGYEDRSEVRKWAIAEKGRLNCLKDKKFLTLKKGSHRHSSLTSGYRVVGIERDGNCFFRCLSQLIHGTQMRHACLRRDLVQYMSCNKDLYCQLVDGSMEDHLHHLEFTDGRTLSWATEAELKAAADWYNMEILVAQNRQFTEWIKFSGEEVDGGTPGICMCLLLENNHFSLLSTIQTYQTAATERGTSKNSSFDWYELSENNGSGASLSESEKSMDQKHRADLDPRPRAEKKQLPRVKTRTTKRQVPQRKAVRKMSKPIYI